MNEWMYDWVMLNDDAYAVDVVSEWRYILYIQCSIWWFCEGWQQMMNWDE